MRKKIWVGISLVLFCTTAFLAVRAVNLSMQKREAAQLYEQMQQEAANQPEEVPQTDASKPEIYIPVDFEALQEINPDIYAWITIPGTEIDYPVVQSSTDNSFYLNHSAEGKKSVSGAIFSENYNSKKFDDYITVLYGHNMRDGTMFRGLHQYADNGFLQENREIIIYLPDAVLKYEIFAAYITDDRHILFYYNQGESEDNRRTFINDILDHRTMQSSLDTSAPVDTDSKILTLSTCHKAGADKRYVVQAYLVEESKGY